MLLRCIYTLWGGFFCRFFLLLLFFYSLFSFAFGHWFPPTPQAAPTHPPPCTQLCLCTDHHLASVLCCATAPSPTDPTCEHYRRSPQTTLRQRSRLHAPQQRGKAAFPSPSRQLSHLYHLFIYTTGAFHRFPLSVTDPIWFSLQLKGGSTAPDAQNLSVCQKDLGPNSVFYHHRKTAARPGCTPGV